MSPLLPVSLSCPIHIWAMFMPTYLSPYISHNSSKGVSLSLGFSVPSLAFSVLSLGFSVPSLGISVPSLEFSVSSLEFSVSYLGFSVPYLSQSNLGKRPAQFLPEISLDLPGSPHINQECFIFSESSPHIHQAYVNVSQDLLIFTRSVTVTEFT